MVVNKKDIVESGIKLQKKIPLVKAEFVLLIFVIDVDIYIL